MFPIAEIMKETYALEFPLAQQDDARGSGVKDEPAQSEVLR